MGILTELTSLLAIVVSRWTLIFRATNTLETYSETPVC